MRNLTKEKSNKINKVLNMPADMMTNEFYCIFVQLVWRPSAVILKRYYMHITRIDAVF